MTYHDALMSQLVALISVVKSVRLRLSDVEVGVVSALKVPVIWRRRSNILTTLQMLDVISRVHETQPSIQLLLTQQDFAGALDLISTSQVRRLCCYKTGGESDRESYFRRSSRIMLEMCWLCVICPLN